MAHIIEVQLTTGMKLRARSYRTAKDWDHWTAHTITSINSSFQMSITDCAFLYIIKVNRVPFNFYKIIRLLCFFILYFELLGYIIYDSLAFFHVTVEIL